MSRVMTYGRISVNCDTCFEQHVAVDRDEVPPDEWMDGAWDRLWITVAQAGWYGGRHSKHHTCPACQSGEQT